MAIISGGKDGRLRDWDLFTGNLNHEVTASVAPIVEIISFSNGEDCKILTMSTKVRI
jgi:WD40 repeat protein